MTEWIKLSERLPRDDETINGRVPILDADGFMGYAVLVDNPNQAPFLFSEFDVVQWLPVKQPK